MLIKRLNRDTFDCFWGEAGWSDWTRYQRNKDQTSHTSYLSKVAGVKPPYEVYEQIKGRLLK